jgi:hypothetical protein
MDLFTPLVSEERLHPNFRVFTQPGFGERELEVINGWADGFIDRDGKFVKEFQTTFNSSFWELYLFACFKELGCTIDFSQEAPDFAVNSPSGEFIAEATTANEPRNFRPEWDRDLKTLANAKKEDVLRLSSIRLANSITAKHKKYTKSYSRLPHVQNKPFVICAAPFDQPSFFSQDALAIVRVLYAYEATLTVPNHTTGRPVIVGESRSYQVQKSPGVNVPLGLFTDDRMSEVSAIIFNNRATISKVRALAEKGDYPIIFMGSRVAKTDSSVGIQPFCEPRPAYQETILDGLHVLVNPFAKYPLDLTMLADREVAIHNYDPDTDSYLSYLPDGFLLQRMCNSITTEKHNVVFRESVSSHPYQEMPDEVWEEDDLTHVGGQTGPFVDNHLAHYRGWTIMVSLCSIDEDWGSQAVGKLCYNIPQFIDANGSDLIASAAIPRWFSTKEKAYIAMKQKIDQTFL